MEVVIPYPPDQGPPPADPEYPPDDPGLRINRASSSPSTMEEGEDEDELEDSDDHDTGMGAGRAARETPPDPQQQPQHAKEGLGCNSLNNERTQKTDARELGAPIVEQLVSRSASSSLSSSASSSEQLHNHNHNNNMEQSEQMEEELLSDGGSPANVEDLASQLYQISTSVPRAEMLQGLVKDMRDGLTSAMEALTHVTPDAALEEKVTAHDDQLADVLRMVLALKAEFAASNETQHQLRGQVDVLQYERDILLEELETHGVVSEKVRQKYHSGRKRPNGLTRANDSTVSVLLERARTAFNPNNGNSDQDSGVNTCHQGDTSTCGEVTPPNISPMVQSYIAGLPHDNHGEVPLDEQYDSDSSITAAANKSLDMSRSLGDKCAELTNVSSSDDEEDDNRRDATSKSDLRKLSPNVQSVGFKRPASPKRTPPHEKSAKELARSRVGREILETERKYCSCLWTILDHFANPLRDTGILPNKELSIMFPECLTRIYEHHCAFLQKLEERIANWRWHGVIGDIFTTFIDSGDYDVLVQYRSYVNEFPAALTQLKKSCRHSLRFRKFLRKCQQDPVCEGLDLAAFLLTPVQRIPRYVLLLKQIMKYTVPEHIDYYYVEACLAKLGTFLTQLNDSIEYSMKVVANDTTPKPKRKIRMGSMRSSGSSEGGPVVTPRDSGVQSAGDNISILSTSSNGRMFQLSVVKDSFSDRPLGVPDPDSRSTLGGAYDSRTLPAMGTRRQRERLRRPKSGDSRRQDDTDTSRNITSGGAGDDEDDNARFLAPQMPPPRPRSVAESNGQISSAQRKTGNPNKVAALNRQQPIAGPSPFRVTSPTPPPPTYATSGAPLRASVSMKSLPDSDARVSYPYVNHSTPQVANAMLHKSLSHLPPPGFGVYGSEEGEEEEGEDGGFRSTSHPEDTSSGATQCRAVKLAHRSRSQGHLTFATQLEESYGSSTPGGASIGGGGGGAGNYTPSQPRINLALARSLTDDASRRLNHSAAPTQQRGSLHRPRSCLLPSAGRTSPGPVPPGTVSLDPGGGSLMNAMRPRASSLSQGTVVPASPPPGPDRPRENVWDESTTAETSALSVSDLTSAGRRKDQKKKKKQKKFDDSVVSDSGRKKTGIKDSIKNIFFKKRKNEKEKIALHDVLAEDTEITTTSIKFPQTNARPSSARSPPANQGTLVVRNGQISLEPRPAVQEDRAAAAQPQPRLKKRPHSVCYGAVTCTPQEKRSSLRTGPSRSSLGSKVVEIGQATEHIPSTSYTSTPASIVPRQTAPPLDESLIVTSRGAASDFATYEDENGDPCSAV